MFLSPVSWLFRLSTVRQTFLLLALFCTVSLLAWGGTYWLIAREMAQSTDARLTSRMNEVVARLETGGELPVSQDGRSVGWADNSWPDGFFDLNLKEKEGPDFRYLVRPTAQGRLAVGENVELQEELLDIMRGGLQSALLATLGLTLVVGVWLARNGQRRVRRINEGLAEVGRGKLDARIMLRGDDDLSLLAARINLTVARLEQAMQQMRMQSSSIAHDLRTPLARLRAQIETNLDALTDRGTQVPPEALEADLEQIDQITEIFDALLRLDRIESGAGKEAFATLTLSTVISAAAEVFEPVISEAGQTLNVQLEGAATILGDENLLVQLIANLLQNALRYGAPAQTITLRCFERTVSVNDEGQGIPLSDRDRVLQPFYQGAAARQGEGSGLGLSLVRAIAELHGADFSLADGPSGRGLAAIIRFPDPADV